MVNKRVQYLNTIYVHDVHVYMYHKDTSEDLIWSKNAGWGMI